MLRFSDMARYRQTILIAVCAIQLAAAGVALGVEVKTRLDQFNEREKQLIEKLESVRQRERYIETQLEDLRRRKQDLLDKREVVAPGAPAATPASDPPPAP
jgi:cell division protein FtsB